MPTDSPAFWIGAALLSAVAALLVHPHHKALRFSLTRLWRNPHLWIPIAAVLLIREVVTLAQFGVPEDPAPLDLGPLPEIMSSVLAGSSRFFLVPWESSPAGPLLFLVGLLGWHGIPGEAWRSSVTLVGKLLGLSAWVLGGCWLVGRFAPLIGIHFPIPDLPNLALSLAGRSFEWLAGLVLVAWLFLALARILEESPIALALDPIHLAARRIGILVPLALLATVLEHLPGWLGWAPLPPWVQGLLCLEILLLAPITYLLVFLEPRPHLLSAANTAFHFQLKNMVWFPYFLVLTLLLLLPVFLLENVRDSLGFGLRIGWVVLFPLLKTLVTVSLVATWFVLMQGKEFRAIGAKSPAANL